jgi:hypothetical protein
MAKRKAKSQTISLTSNHEKTGIDLTTMRVGGVGHTVGKLSTRAITLLRPRPDQRSQRKVIAPQSYGSPNPSSFGTSLWES